MSFFLSNDSPVLDCHFHLKISHFMAPHFMCISGITQDRNYVCYFRSRPPSRSPPFDTEQPDLVIFRLLVPLKRLTPGSLPASTFGLMLFVEHRQAFYPISSPSSIASAQRSEVFSSFVSGTPRYAFYFPLLLASGHDDLSPSFVLCFRARLPPGALPSGTPIRLRAQSLRSLSPSGAIPIRLRA